MLDVADKTGVNPECVRCFLNKNKFKPDKPKFINALNGASM